MRQSDSCCQTLESPKQEQQKEKDLDEGPEVELQLSVKTFFTLQKNVCVYNIQQTGNCLQKQLPENFLTCPYEINKLCSTTEKLKCSCAVFLYRQVNNISFMLVFYDFFPIRTTKICQILGFLFSVGGHHKRKGCGVLYDLIKGNSFLPHRIERHCLLSPFCVYYFHALDSAASKAVLYYTFIK